MNEMQRQGWLYGAIGLLLGIIIGAAVSAYAVNNSMTGMMRMMGMGAGAQKMQQWMDEHHDEDASGASPTSMPTILNQSR